MSYEIKDYDVGSVAIQVVQTGLALYRIKTATVIIIDYAIIIILGCFRIYDVDKTPIKSLSGILIH